MTTQQRTTDDGTDTKTTEDAPEWAVVVYDSDDERLRESTYTTRNDAEVAADAVAMVGGERAEVMPVTDAIEGYLPHATSAAWNRDVDPSEPDERLADAEGATWSDAIALERRADRLGVEVVENYLAYLADDESEFPAGMEVSANAQAKFVAGEDPVDAYREYDGATPGLISIERGANTEDRLAYVRACMVAGEGPFGEPRNHSNEARIYTDDLGDASREVRTDGGSPIEATDGDGPLFTDEDEDPESAIERVSATICRRCGDHIGERDGDQCRALDTVAEHIPLTIEVGDRMRDVSGVAPDEPGALVEVAGFDERGGRVRVLAESLDSDDSYSPSVSHISGGISAGHIDFLGRAPFEFGDVVVDREAEEGIHDAEGLDSDRAAVVLDVPGLRAEDVQVGSTGQTVASFNRDHPGDDEVVEVAFASELDGKAGRWRQALDAGGPDELAAHLDSMNDRVIESPKTYSYPASRLRSLGGGSDE